MEKFQKRCLIPFVNLLNILIHSQVTFSSFRDHAPREFRNSHRTENPRILLFDHIVNRKAGIAPADLIYVLATNSQKCKTSHSIIFQYFFCLPLDKM